MERASTDLIEVVIAGVPLRLKSSKDQAQVKTLIKMVDLKIQEILKSSRTSSNTHAAILAALNFAEELQTLRQETAQQLAKLESLTESAIGDLEASRISQTGLDA